MLQSDMNTERQNDMKLESMFINSISILYEFCFGGWRAKDLLFCFWLECLRQGSSLDGLEFRDHQPLPPTVLGVLD